jgi:hypothetical protein
MTSDTIPISAATRGILLELADRTGRPPAELLDAAVEALRSTLGISVPITSIPGVDPADVWEAANEADAGQLSSHGDVFARP